MRGKKTLVVLTGPTGVGKTELSLSLAEALGSPIINADSRQIYHEIPIGTAAPTAEEQARVHHYFVGCRQLTEDYNAGMYEREVLALTDELFETHNTLVMTGGSMLYIDAVCKGLDDIPTVPELVRSSVREEYATKGIEWLQGEVREADPAYFAEADIHNPQRLLHALEICRATGKPYSTYRTGRKKERPFRVVKIGLNRPRTELYDRINRRVDAMLAQGLLEEARAVLPLRGLNALNTVGYKEMFRYLDGEWSLEQAADMIRQNSRHYAKRQLTWYNADPEMHWVNPAETSVEQLKEIINEN